MTTIDIDTPSMITPNVDEGPCSKAMLDNIDKMVKRAKQSRKEAIAQPSLLNWLLELLSMLATVGAMISAAFDVSDTLKMRTV